MTGSGQIDDDTQIAAIADPAAHAPDCGPRGVERGQAAAQPGVAEIDYRAMRVVEREHLVGRRCPVQLQLEAGALAGGQELGALHQGRRQCRGAEQRGQCQQQRAAGVQPVSDSRSSSARPRVLDTHIRRSK